MNASTPDTTERLDALMREAIDRYRLPGLVVVVERDGEQLFAAGVGAADAAGLHRPGADTLFGVASLTKLITAVALLRLQDRGALSIDDPVTRHWPALRLARNAPIRLTHLLSHSGGLPGLPGRFHALNLADADDRSGGVGSGGPASQATSEPPRHAGLVAAADLVDFINSLDFEPLAPPGELLNYSNEGYCLLGGAIEAATGMRYADAVAELVLAPLGMTHTTFGVPAVQRLGNVAMPIALEQGRWRELGFWDAPLFYPTGGAVASARDLLRLVRVLDDDCRLLTPHARHRLSRVEMPVASRPGDATGYGLALEHHRIDDTTTLLWHSGQRAGISSFVGRVPQARLAAAVLTNVAQAPAAQIGHEVIGLVLGRDDLRWPAPRPVVLEAPMRAPARARFVGDYGGAEGFGLEVRDDGESLSLVANGAAEPLCFSDADSGTVGGKTFRFLPDAQGRTWALALELRVLPRTSAARAIAAAG